jgi:hypothetical protein
MAMLRQAVGLLRWRSTPLLGSRNTAVAVAHLRSAPSAASPGSLSTNESSSTARADSASSPCTKFQFHPQKGLACLLDLQAPLC